MSLLYPLLRSHPILAVPSAVPSPPHANPNAQAVSPTVLFCIASAVLFVA
uniref:Uncharacterized protein n=1 Tax=Myoviridae sp. ctBtT5 TaxID=2825048 RepID=A0A8S5PZ91_9CAUD|nr:MAG TPA: hypothetical protein [Myoviridae sp. ctBtT5]